MGLGQDSGPGVLNDLLHFCVVWCIADLACTAVWAGRRPPGIENIQAAAVLERWTEVELCTWDELQQPALGDTVFICSSFVLESVFVLFLFFLMLLHWLFSYCSKWMRFEGWAEQYSTDYSNHSDGTCKVAVKCNGKLTTLFTVCKIKYPVGVLFVCFLKTPVRFSLFVICDY